MKTAVSEVKFKVIVKRIPYHDFFSDLLGKRNFTKTSVSSQFGLVQCVQNRDSHKCKHVFQQLAGRYVSNRAALFNSKSKTVNFIAFRKKFQIKERVCFCHGCTYMLVL